MITTIAAAGMRTRTGRNLFVLCAPGGRGSGIVCVICPLPVETGGIASDI
jgi:hypothetical protein